MILISNFASFQSSRGGISIQTEIYPNLIMSRLTVAAVTTKDAGIYTCKPIKGLAHNVTLIVIQSTVLHDNRHKGLN